MLDLIKNTSLTMPASLYTEMNSSNGVEGHVDQQALQIAFELSMLGLNGDEENGSGGSGLASPGLSDAEARKRSSANMTECVPVPSSEHVAEIVGRQGKYFIHSR